MVTWNSGVCFRARASRSTPEYGAPMMKTGWRTLRPLTTRMCGRGGMAVHQCGIARSAGEGAGRPLMTRSGRGSGRDWPSRRHSAVVPRVVVQVQRRLDQRYVTERLRSVANQAAVPRVVLLAEQAQVGAQRQQPLEQGHCLLVVADQVQRVDPPEA